MISGFPTVISDWIFYCATMEILMLDYEQMIRGWIQVSAPIMYGHEILHCTLRDLDLIVIVHIFLLIKLSGQLICQLLCNLNPFSMFTSGIFHVCLKFYVIIVMLMNFFTKILCSLAICVFFCLF